MVREIQMSNSAAPALVDDEDYDLAATHKWHAHQPKGKHTFHARRSVWNGSRQVTLHLHTFLTGWPLVDHINGDGLDNRRANLRPATNAQNQHNARLRIDNSSGFKGVSFYKKSGRWMASIRVAGRQRYLGYHDTPEEAARAYDAAARELHGEFAALNFPLPGERSTR